MKKLIAAVLAILCLAACSAKTEPAPEAGVSVVTKTESAPPQAEKPVENFEIEVEESKPAAPVAPDLTPGAYMSIETVEGLVGDAVGYALQKPVFSGCAAAETMNAFYDKLVAGLEDYANGKVNENCLTNNCIASVYGEVTQTGHEDGLQIDYTCRVEYSNAEEPVINHRTEIWNTETGEVISEVG